MGKAGAIFGAIFFAALAMTGCTGGSNHPKETETTSGALDPGKSVSDEVVPEQEAMRSGIAELLQGKWQHVDDKSNYLVFEGNHRKETAGGSDQWDDELFVLSDKCANDFNKNSETEPEKDRYISCLASDLCWYILDVDQETLSLSYMGRGNTLTYKRVH